jgi:hypothetical protein
LFASYGRKSKALPNAVNGGAAVFFKNLFPLDIFEYPAGKNSAGTSKRHIKNKLLKTKPCAGNRIGYSMCPHKGPVF